MQGPAVVSEGQAAKAPVFEKLGIGRRENRAKVLAFRRDTSHLHPHLWEQDKRTGMRQILAPVFGPVLLDYFASRRCGIFFLSTRVRGSRSYGDSAGFENRTPGGGCSGYESSVPLLWRDNPSGQLDPQASTADRVLDVRFGFEAGFPVRLGSPNSTIARLGSA